MSLLNRSLAFMLFLAAPQLFGAPPPIYLLRATPYYRHGIFRLNPESGVQTPVADFVYKIFGAGDSGLQLSTLADRIVVQGAPYYEFDAASGQLLRRYAGLAPPYDTWAFHGVAVDEAASRVLGIAPGYYGFPACPPGPETGAGCLVPALPFPGYDSRSNVADSRVFLRRSLDPADPTLTVAHIFATDFRAGSERFAALDLGRRQFWFWLQQSVDDGTGYLRRLVTAPIRDGAIGDEATVREEHIRLGDPDERWRGVLAFAFDPSRDSFLMSMLHVRPCCEYRLVRQSVAGAEEILARPPAGISFDGIALAQPSLPEVYTQLLPAVADAPGANGTYWRSDAWFFNPSEETMQVALQRVSKPGVVRRLTLEPHASLKVPNILRELGGGAPGDGSTLDAVTIESPHRSGAQLSVYSRTYTPSAEGGSYGEAVPAVPSLLGYSNHLATTTGSAAIAGTHSVFILDKRNPRQFRHNVGVVNTSDVPISIRLRYSVVSTLPLIDPRVERIVVVPPHALRQYQIETLFPREVVEALPAYIVVAGDHPAALWLSMVDNISGDASFIPFTFYGMEVGPEARLAFPVVAHTWGLSGTFWKTDGYGIFWGQSTGVQAQSPDANFYGTCSDGATRTLIPSPSAPNNETFSPFWFTTYADLLKQRCPDTEYGSGALEVRTGSWMSMVARTYTTRADGGTYGDILPLYPPRGWPSRHFGIELSAAARVNLGLYNGSDAQSTLMVRLFNSSGSLVEEKLVMLQPRETRQTRVRQLFATDFPDGTYGLSILTVEGVGCWPYVSTVDNVTGDPTNWW